MSQSNSVPDPREVEVELTYTVTTKVRVYGKEPKERADAGDYLRQVYRRSLEREGWVVK